MPWLVCCIWRHQSTMLCSSSCDKTVQGPFFFDDIFPLIQSQIEDAGMLYFSPIMHIESLPVFTSLIASLIVSSVQFPILWGCAAIFNYDIVYLEVYHIPTWVGWRTLTSNTKCWDEDLSVLDYIMMLPQMDSNTFKSPVTKFASGKQIFLTQVRITGESANLIELNDHLTGKNELWWPQKCIHVISFAWSEQD